jgi:hypothetical protein
MSKRKLRDPGTLEIALEMLEVLRDARSFARDLERRGLSPDIEWMEATLAKFWAPEQDDTAWNAFDHIEQRLRRTRTVLEQLAAAQPRQQAVRIKREVDALTDEFKRSGARQPRKLAWEKVAKRERRSVAALKRWANRNC